MINQHRIVINVTNSSTHDYSLTVDSLDPDSSLLETTCPMVKLIVNQNKWFNPSSHWINIHELINDITYSLKDPNPVVVTNMIHRIITEDIKPKFYNLTLSDIGLTSKELDRITPLELFRKVVSAEIDRAAALFAEAKSRISNTNAFSNMLSDTIGCPSEIVIPFVRVTQADNGIPTEVDVIFNVPECDNFFYLKDAKVRIIPEWNDPNVFRDVSLRITLNDMSISDRDAIRTITNTYPEWPMITTLINGVCTIRVCKESDLHLYL